MTKNSKKPTAVERAAYHEAGHAVMAYLSRRRFCYVTIDQNELDEVTRGFVRVSRLKSSWNDICCSGGSQARATIEREIKITIAGEAAEALLAGRNNWVGAKQDIEKCYDFCGSQCGSMEESDAYLKWLWLRVQNKLKLPLNWACVQALAGALLKHRRIGYPKACAIIEQAEMEQAKIEETRIRKRLNCTGKIH
jgi:hypothetical protein